MTIDSAPVGHDPKDPIAEGFGTLLKGIGWGIGFIGFGLMWAFSNGINPF